MSRGQVHNALPRSPLASALSRMVGDTTGETGLERYGETLTPILDPWKMAEWFYLRRERLASGWSVVTAVAGENSTLSFVNPSGSKKIVVLERFIASADAAGTVTLSYPIDASAIVGAAVATSNSLDSRYGANNYPVALVYQGTTAAPPAGRANIQNVYIPANTPHECLFGPLVLIPRTVAQFWLSVVNQSLRGTFIWRERNALPGELE